MARRALGNDPFARGAAARLPAEPQAPAVVPPKPPPAAERPSPKRPTPKVEPAPRPAAVVSPPALPAPRVPPPTSAAEVAMRELVETTGARLRTLLEKRLPALIEGLTKASIEALGITAQPVNVSDVDAFGMSPEFVQRWQPVLARVLHNYFRTELIGLEKLPASGPAILVCNHSGVLPYDELLLSVAVREGAPHSGGGEAHKGRELRPLSEDFAINAPFAGSWLNRFGLVRASQDNAERLLRGGDLVAAFPEGSQGIGKLYRNRYRLQRFGRGGFVRLALRTQVPIYPVALVGGEESQPVVARVRLPRPLRLSHLPITPTFPLLGPLGLLPLPSRWSVQVGDPIVLPHSPADADDRPLVGKLSEEIREQLQQKLDAAVARRTSLFL